MAARDERMGAFDAVMYGIEGDPVLRTGIIAVILLDGEPDSARLIERTDRLTRLYPRLRSRAVGSTLSPAPPRWEIDPHFDLSYHLRWRRLPVDGAPISAALDYAARMVEADFDHSRPLWEVAVLTDLVDGRAAMVFKIHHSVADGMGGIQMSAALFDLAPETPELGPMPPAPEAAPAGIVDRVRHVVAFEAGALGEVVTGSVNASLRAVGDLVRSPFSSTMSAGRTAAAIAETLAPQGDPKSTWMSERSLSSVFTMLDVPLDALKATAREAEVTVNVVFLAAVADAVGSYHRANGQLLASMRVNMPVDQRKPGDSATGNHWVPARFLVPTRDAEPRTRLFQLHGLIDEARNDPALGFSDLLYKGMALLPDPLTALLAGSLMKGVDVAATNVPGPGFGVYLCGARVTGLVPFAPKSGAAINIGLLSYDGHAFVGVNSDPAAVEDPAEFTALLAAAFAKYTG